MIRNDLDKLARIGARIRLNEIERERQKIISAFPGLTADASATGAAKSPRRFSAAGKSAISEGMRKYWARRKAKAAKPTKPSS